MNHCVFNLTNQITIEEIVEIYNVIQLSASEAYDGAFQHKLWYHPANVLSVNNANPNFKYCVQVYTDVNNTDNCVEFGVEIFVDAGLVCILQYRLDNKCSNNEAEQFAILKALDKFQK